MMRTIVGTVLALSTLLPGLAQAQTEQVFYYHTDAIGSVRMITDGTGQVVARYDYLPFGEPCGSACGTPSAPDKREFAGKERDQESGLDYFVARYYTSLAGRFTTVDPNHAGIDTLDPQTWNGYAYARNNPLRFIDPRGLACTKADYSDTSTCVEGEGGTGQFTIDYTWFLLASIGKAYWEAMHDYNRPTRAEFPLLPPFLAPESIGVGAMRRLTFDEAASASRHIPGITRIGTAAGPINGQSALDTSITISSNTARRVGIDYAKGEFVVFDEHLPGLFHGHVRSWEELTPSMQAALRKAGMVTGRGQILQNTLLKP